MGCSMKFNWVLQIELKEEIEVNKRYKFIKDGNRIFPLNTPIDMICLDRKAVAKIKVLEFTNIEGETTGIYEVIKRYSGIEKDVLSNYWIENQ